MDGIGEKYFQKCPDSESLMTHIDELVRGKMMDEVYRLMMVDNYGDEESYLNWEVDNHEMAYSVEPHMYEALFDALIETIKDCLGDAWNPAYEAQWFARTDNLREEIINRFTTSA